MAVTPTNTFGTTVAFATTSFAPKLRGIRINPGERNSIDTSHLNLTVYDGGVSAFATTIPGGIIRGASIEFDVTWTFDDEPPISKANETITVTFNDSGTTDGVFACSGHVTTYGIEGGDDTEWTGTVSCALSGDPTWTNAA